MSLRICVLVPVGVDTFNQPILESIRPVIPADVEVEARNLPRGTSHIQDRIDWLANGLAVVETALQLEREGFDGIWLSDFDMCGVEAAREAVNIPIVGGFPTAAFSALLLCQRFSIVTVLQSTLAMQHGHVQAYGLQDSFSSIRAIDCPVDQLSNMDVVVPKVYECALEAVRRDGAQSILLGCTGFVGVARRVEQLLEATLGCYVPVIDPNQAGFSLLLSLVRMRVRPSRLCYGKESLPVITSLARQA
ncbi:aspartate/glutamate racemase family protein [Chromobacterium violaceum]|uniref:aspartate/glutamate racemase family protein n=1 Tax=Chromobacterium violaceum TaxID=536 RepID=UPI001BE5D58E|nr:aspartate/glutamate racemase family protein [Chromobacterium violaceum]MBT2867486.1 aspartate/glutamate racemase family protein [Chromobacterium violaceum]